MARIVPSALMLTPRTAPGATVNGPRRSDRLSTSQSVAWPSTVTAASVRPSGAKASALTSPPVSERGGPTGVRSFASQSPMPSLVEAEREQPSVGAEAPGVPVITARDARSCVKVKRRPSPRSPPMSQAIAVPS